MIRRLLHPLARTAFLLLAFLSSTYCLLAFIPFTYQAVIRFPMVSWMPGFVRLHPHIFLVALVLNAAAEPSKTWKPLRWGQAGFYLLNGLLGLVMVFRPVLATLQNDRLSWAWSLAFLASALWVVVLDVVEALGGAEWQPAPADLARRLFLSATASSLLLTAVYGGLATLKPVAEGKALLPEAVRLVVGWNLSGNLLLFLVLATLLMALVSLGRLLPWTWTEPLLLAAFLATATGWFLQKVVFAAIAFSGPEATLMAALLGLLAALLPLRAGLRLHPTAPEPTESGLDFLLRPLTVLLQGHWLRGILWFAGVVALTWFLQTRSERFDWNFLFQKISMVLAGGLFFAGGYALLRPRPSGNLWIWTLILAPILVLNVFLTYDDTLIARRTARKALPALGNALEAQAGRNVSVRFLGELLAPLPEAQRSIYRFLQQCSNISRDVRTDPVPIQHVERFKPTEGESPDIYIVVVDSLRRDYVGAYNPAVTFTPNLNRFASESVVFRNAFTRYGATGLSEPSIWTGALMLHKQYITPFHPMNSLQKVLEAKGYQAEVSMDTVMDVVVKPAPWVSSLDPGVGTHDLRLTASLQKLEAAVQARGQDRRPVFAYSQGQDIHISVINQEGQTIVQPGDYRGFYAPYASRLQRIDTAFGAFVDYLKRSGRYDRSIVIFTADHGDSLGEEGRFGHAYTLFPEILRIPMLVHLPPGLKQQMTWDADAVSFLTDLTPSLYYLLGQRPVTVNRLFGRPLFTTTPEERVPYKQDRYLMASSYGAVFGILEGNGRTLYISDGVNFQDHLYQVDDSAAGVRRQLSPEAKQRYDQAILDELAQVNRFYHFEPRR